MSARISDEEREQAIQYLIENIPEGALMRIFEDIYKDPDLLMLQHFGIGMQVRNLLRAGGFAWSDTVLDREWEPITLETARRAYKF
ncbi:hypothetical protein [Methanoculleus horonobensis]|uniref:hypothetical protein n=1 Tax=Methanoculleus horonobensis TaxID=528314 RepID=UPI00082FF149|nr:hypothetical protein [Methanoculleus horonobensis]